MEPGGRDSYRNPVARLDGGAASSIQLELGFRRKLKGAFYFDVYNVNSFKESYQKLF